MKKSFFTEERYSFFSKSIVKKIQCRKFEMHPVFVVSFLSAIFADSI